MLNNVPVSVTERFPDGHSLVWKGLVKIRRKRGTWALHSLYFYWIVPYK